MNPSYFPMKNIKSFHFYSTYEQRNKNLNIKLFMKVKAMS